MNSIEIDGTSLTIEEVYKVAHQKVHVTLSDQARTKTLGARALVDEIVKAGKPVYGINTGFGALSNKFIEHDKLEILQYNLIRSHCTGVGKPFSVPITKAIMLLRANCLSSGFSGVSIEAIDLLLDFINNDIIPVVPEKGSVGASGDLAPLSHIALALIGEGDVLYNGKEVRADFAIHSINKEPVQLKAKDGLALINGTAVMLALGSLALYETRELVKLADVSSALTLDAVRGTTKAFNEQIMMLKPHSGQIVTAKNLRELLKDSEIVNSHDNCGKVQDPYSLRCIPQVHGSIRQTLDHTWDVFTTELNSVTDNPLVFVKTKEVLSGGNFHGEALALSMDYLAMGLSELANISERRVEKMMNPVFSDLPAFLTKNSGLNSGLMIAHVTMASLVNENKVLCYPASVDSIPTSTDKEDHVSMGVTSGRKLYTILSNVKDCLAIELLCNTQGISLLRPLKTSTLLEKVITHIRQHVPIIEDDRVFCKDINKIRKLIDNFELVNIVRNVIN